MAYIKKQVAQLADKDGNPIIGNVTTVLGSSAFANVSSTLLGITVYNLLMEHGLIKTSTDVG